MLKTLTALVAALSLVLVAGCSGTQQERQESADQIFGKAKVGLVAETAIVGVYNALCASTLKESSVCAEPIARIVNTTLATTADTIAAAEKVFADANSTDAERLDVAKLATGTVAELIAIVTKNDLAKLVGGR